MALEALQRPTGGWRPAEWGQIARSVIPNYMATKIPMLKSKVFGSED